MRDVSPHNTCKCPYDQKEHEWEIKINKYFIEKLCKKCGFLEPEPIYEEGEDDKN